MGRPPHPGQPQPALITYKFADMVLARTMMIAAEHDDCDDIDRLKTDPALKIACDRAPETGVDLMRQPTLSRLENVADTKAVYQIGIGLSDLYRDGHAMTPTIPFTAASNSRSSTRMLRGEVQSIVK